MGLIDTQEGAERLANAIATDLRLYHDKDVAMLRREGVMTEALREAIVEGQMLCTRRIAPALRSLPLLEEALEDLSAGLESDPELIELRLMEREEPGGGGGAGGSALSGAKGGGGTRAELQSLFIAIGVAVVVGLVLLAVLWGKAS